MPRATFSTLPYGFVAAALLGCGSGSGGACPGGCPGPAFARFVLACSPSDLVSVHVTGPCIADDAGQSYLSSSSAVYVDSVQPGTCHVQLAFATGYTYSAEVQFLLQSNNVPSNCACAQTVAPTQQTFSVGNSIATCQDAGPDATED